MVRLIRKVVLERCCQEGPEFTSSRVNLSECLVIEQMQKEPLSKILRFVGIVSAPPDESVNRVPVGLAKLGERICGAGCLALSREKHRTPRKWYEIARRHPLETDGPTSILTLLQSSLLSETSKEISISNAYPATASPPTEPRSISKTLNSTFEMPL